MTGIVFKKHKFFKKQFSGICSIHNVVQTPLYLVAKYSDPCKRKPQLFCKDFQFICCLPQLYPFAPEIYMLLMHLLMFSRNMLSFSILIQFLATEKKGKSFHPFQGPRQMRYTTPWESGLFSSPLNQGPGPHPRSVGCYLYDWCHTREGMGQEPVRMPQSFPAILKLCFSWFSISFVPINLWPFPRVLIKLILTIFPQYFSVSVEGWALGDTYPDIFTDVTGV